MNPSKRIARNRMKARFVRNRNEFNRSFNKSKRFRTSFDLVMKQAGWERKRRVASLRSVPYV